MTDISCQRRSGYGPSASLGKLRTALRSAFDFDYVIFRVLNKVPQFRLRSTLRPKRSGP